jgi:hypothetical protein
MVAWFFISLACKDFVLMVATKTAFLGMYFVCLGTDFLQEVISAAESSSSRHKRIGFIAGR